MQSFILCILAYMRWRTPAVILACGGIILALALGTRQTFGLFLRPMSMELGWGREAFSFAIALQNLVWGCAMPFMGAIADRYGAGRVFVAGGLAYGSGVIAMAYSTTPLAFDLSAGLLLGFGLSCTGFGVVMGVVARAFPPEKRSVAVGLTGAAGSFGQFAMLPAAQGLIGNFGWLAALVVFGILAFLMIPLGAALAEATRHRGFWLLTASFFVCGFQTLFIMVHLPAYLVDRGLSATDGMTALALIGFFNIIGSYVCGALGGRYSKRLILAWIYAIRALAIGVFIAAPLTPLGTYLFAALLGLTWLGTVPLTNSLVGQIFGVKFLSTLFSITFLGHQLGAFLGVWAGGAVFDAFNSYLPVWIGSIALSVVAAALCVPINERALRPA